MDPKKRERREKKERKNRRREKKKVVNVRVRGQRTDTYLVTLDFSAPLPPSAEGEV